MSGVGRPQPPAPAEGARRPRRSAALLLYLAVGAALLAGLAHYSDPARARTKTLTWDRFQGLVSESPASPIAWVEVGPEVVVGELKEERMLPVLKGEGRTEAEPVQRFQVVRLPGDEEVLANELKTRGITVVGERGGGWGRLLGMWTISTLLLIAGLFLVLRLVSPSRQVMSFGKSRARIFAEKETKTTFEMVAGIDEAKEELAEVVQFLRDPRPYHRVGARIPRGVLLVGPPGTGKTLLARAVAGEASVTFFSLSGSDFVEMFAGVGASRVRDLFEQASKQAPCIVFIDELDALGKVRGVGISGAHDEREQTLNQLLSEMDGFDPEKGVVILAATNRPEILDPALLRPGRFDRQVVVDRPDVKGREKILHIHARKIRLSPTVDLARVARETPGLVGADLANVVNEAALLAGRKRKEEVGPEEFHEAIQRQLVGLERKSRIIGPVEKERIAVHETGHALVALSVPHADPVARVSIIARGAGALGYTMQLPSEDRHLYTRRELEDRLAVLLGGRGAEQLIYDDLSTGAGDDLARATDIARRMVLEFGMSRLGPISYQGQRLRFMPGEHPPERREYSEETARAVDAEVTDLVRQAEERVVAILREREPALRAIATALVQREVVLAEELAAIARAHGADPIQGNGAQLALAPAPGPPAT